MYIVQPFSFFFFVYFILLISNSRLKRRRLFACAFYYRHFCFTPYILASEIEADKSVSLLLLLNAIFNFFDEIFIIKWISFSTSLGTFGTSHYFSVSMICQESFFQFFGVEALLMSCGV